MNLPDYLRSAAEKICGAYRPTELREVSRALSSAYLDGKGDGSRIVMTDRQAAVYAAVRMPATYGAAYSALRYATEGSDTEFFTMLDAGAGTGAAFFAAHELFGISEAVLAERESAMLSLAATFAEAAGLKAETLKCDLKDFEPRKSFDLVVASYVLNEMDAKSLEAALDKLAVCSGKLLVIVEPGTPRASLLQRKIRSYLSGKGAKLVAPCPEGAECRLREGDWCHFAVRVARGKLHKYLKEGDAPYEDEKFTYSAFRFDGADNACSARVLRHPVISKGRADLTLCTKEGVVEVAVRKQDGAPWKTARKLEAGDKFEMPEDTL